MALKQKTFQMVTRVQPDASHVSRGVTVRREKTYRYIRNS